MKGVIIVIPEHLSADAQRMWQVLASENGLAYRSLQAEQLQEVPPRDVVAIACALGPGEREFPSPIVDYLRNDLEQPPVIIAQSAEELVDPVISLDEGRIILCSPRVGELQLRSILLHVLRLHPLAFRVIDSEAGEVQVDHSSNEWWVSCRREAHSNSPWPYARPGTRMNISCGWRQNLPVLLSINKKTKTTRNKHCQSTFNTNRLAKP